jgi:hypothetical protein
VMRFREAWAAPFQELSDATIIARIAADRDGWPVAA